MAPGPAVVDVELDREHELRVAYDDGVTAVFPLLELREACPCAGCRGRRERGLTAATTPGTGTATTAADGRLHGNWGIAIRWSDGHDTGIYAWDQLRQWWDAGASAADTEYPR